MKNSFDPENNSVEFDFFDPDMEIVNQLEEFDRHQFIRIIEFYQSWKNDLLKDFKVQIKSLKPIFKQRGLFIPNDPITLFKDFFEDYKEANKHLISDDEIKINEGLEINETKKNLEKKTLKLYPKKLELSENEILYLAEPSIDPKFLLNWAASYTFQLQNNEVKADQEKISGGVRYLVFNEFFELKKEHRGLNEKQITKLISVLFEKDIRTAKGYKNGEEKYIKPKGLADAKELIEKIKKGDFL